ncbi:MAG: hypothetical protein RR239_03520, partial [Oscillospiraceae bacterium]
FDDCNIDLSQYRYINALYSPIEIADGATVNIYVKGNTSFWGGGYCAGIHKALKEGTLNVYVQDGSQLLAAGREGAAGIGGNCLNPDVSFMYSKYKGSDASNINICAKEGWTGKIEVDALYGFGYNNFNAIGAGSEGTQDNINLKIEFPLLAKPDNNSTDRTAADRKLLNGRFGVIPLGYTGEMWVMKYELSNLLIIDNYTGKNIDGSKISCNDYSPSIDVAGSYTLKKRDDTSTMVPQQLFINGQGQTDLTLSNLDYGYSQIFSLNFTSNVSNGFLILDGNNRLKGVGGVPGIGVNSTGSLTISGSGSLDVTGGNGCAGISSSKDPSLTSNINITGGTINANGGSQSAGIGSSKNSSSTLNINITGGTITANGGSGCAGIGSGYNSSSTSNINISGGTITANGGYASAGIGSSEKFSSTSNINISGGTINANGGYESAGIGSGYSSSSKSNINITGGTIKAIGGGAGAGIGSGADASIGNISISGNAYIT